MQDFRGLYQSSFIVQTLGEHFSAIDGFQKIPGVHDRKARPRGALALSIAAVGNLKFLPLATLITNIGRAGINALVDIHDYYRHGPHSKEQEHFVAEENKPSHRQNI
jgi:hypothetical protein